MTKQRVKAPERMSGFCSTEQLALEGRLRSTTAPEGWHRLCRAANCSCPNHDGEARCRHCGESLGTEGAEECANQAACADRVKRQLLAHPKHAQIEEARKHAEKARADKPKGDRARGSGRCEHCGGPTAGGKFQMGHDMKLKGHLFRIARGQTNARFDAQVAAAAEIMLRKWNEADIQPDVLEAAHELIDHPKSDAWLQGRIEKRWEQGGVGE